MPAEQHFEQDGRQGLPGTLGDVLYSDRSKVPPSEKEWLRLVQSIAGGDQLALHALYEGTHRVVFTLISRITGNQETTEELTLDVFCDVWRQASHYDPADRSVLGWIMNQARLCAIDRLRSEQPETQIDAHASDLSFDAGDSQDVLESPQAALLQERLARRIAASTGAKPVLPVKQQWFEPEWAEVAPGISCKLLATDTDRHSVSMLVRLAPGGDYPPHTHAGVEELHLLHGELWIDDRKLYPGDYNRAEPGTSDKRVWSETGCTCVLMTSTKDILRRETSEDDDTARSSHRARAISQPEDIYRATLVRAAEFIGGAVPLAHRLQVPLADLERWLAGLDRPSMGTFLKVVDLLIDERGKPRSY